MARKIVILRRKGHIRRNLPLNVERSRIEYVLIGHSERRQIFGETNQQVAEKFIAALQHGLKPILCIGESKEEREAGETFNCLTDQLAFLFESQISEERLHDAVIAYEPIWAIGTGLTATPWQAQEVHEHIRQLLMKLNKSLAEKVRILYGGSVKQSNAADLFKMPDIDGGLIGGASLNVNEFLEIVKLCSSL